MSEVKKILVVDDEPELREMIQMRLEAGGYQAVLATNGQEGLVLVLKEAPNLIISDVLMPVMDGFAFYKELKKNVATAQIPVLILTARGKMEDTFKVVGADAFIAKPFDSEELIEKVKFLLTRGIKTSPMAAVKKVLVAGTDKDVVYRMALQIKQEGHQVEAVTSGPEVIAKTVVFAPHVIVMEVQMDILPSEDIIRVLKQMPQFQKVPILLYSYYSMAELGTQDVRQKALSVEEARVNCMQTGADEFLGRYNENVFMKKIAHYL
jgi:CheY-like chemotaxis protein